MGIFTGDFVFVGSIGRPDLLEEAAGIAGTAEPGARDLYKSIAKFNALPDFLQVWPAHGAGSACGKGLGAIPSSTVGYEKRFNPAFQFASEEEFVDYILSEQPEAPKYFAVMKQVNKDGPKIIDDELPSKLSLDSIGTIAADNMVIDTRSSHVFAKGHVPGSINIPTEHLAAWAGWLVNYDQPIFLLTSGSDLSEAHRVLRKIGIDQIGGYFDTEQAATADVFKQSYEELPPDQLANRIEDGTVILIDVRGDTEWSEAYIEKAQRSFLADLPDRLSEFNGPCTLAFHCRSGARSAIAVSLAQAAGIENAINMTGGIDAWMDAGLKTKSCAATSRGPRREASENELACQSQAVYWDAACPAAASS